MLEYLTEDGLFSIDMALRPPPRSRGSPLRQPQPQPQPTQMPPTASAGGSGSAAQQSPDDARSDGANPAESGDDLSLDGADSRIAGPAAGRFLMLRPGFRLRGPERWRPGSGDGGYDNDPQPSRQLQVGNTRSVNAATLGYRLSLLELSELILRPGNQAAQYDSCICLPSQL